MTSHECMLADLPILLMAPIGLIMVGVHAGSKKLCHAHGLIYPQVVHCQQCKWRSNRDTCFASALWAGAVACRCLLSDALFQRMETCYLCAFTICSGALVAQCICAMHVCNCLTSLGGAFSSEASDWRETAQKHECGRDQQTTGLIFKWRRIQAAIRFSSGAVEHPLVCLHVAMLSALVFGVVDLLHSRTSLHALAPSALLFVLVTATFLRAAAVTDMCALLPSDISSNLYDDDAVDWHRRYLVWYIADSAAGCRVFGVQVTTALVLKFLHFCGAFMVALLLKVF